MTKEGWVRKKIKDICDKASSNIVQNKVMENNGDYPLYGASGFVKCLDFYHRDEPYIGIVKDGSGVGRVNVYPAYSSLVGTMQYVIPKNGFLLGYIKYVLQSLNLAHFASGAAIPHIYFKDYGECTVLIPPLSEQESIVAELDKLNEILAKKQEQLKELDRLGQAIFYDMFGDPILNENGWEIDVWKKMFDTRLGKMLDKKKQVVTDRKLYYLGNSNVLWGDFNLKSLNSMSFSEREIEQLKLKKGDLLICEGGDAGRCAIWEEDNSEILFQKAIHRARIKDRSVLDIRYVQALLFEMKRLGGLKNYLSKATIEHLTGEKLNTLQIPVPPITIQQSFAQRMEQIESQKLKIIQSLKDVQQLLDYTMNKYFG